jgi:hypothetical protein
MLANEMPSFINITNTYCGKTGCACGCGGAYAAPLHADANSWTPRSDRTVKMRLNKLMKAWKDNPASVTVEPFGDSCIWEYEYGAHNDYDECRVIRIYATRG